MDIANLEQLKDISSLSRALRKSEQPEILIRSQSAQTLYMLINYEGLGATPEIIEAATVEQTRLLLDFDIWNGENLTEEKIWNWLEISSEDDELPILNKIVNSLDLKIVAYLINKYVEAVQNDEPTEAPPGPLFYTPDKGHTWIRVTHEDERSHFLMSKLLAYLFESNTDVFYQLLATQAVSTCSLLEHEAEKDRARRLAAEGFPEREVAFEMTSFMSVTDALKELSENLPSQVANEIVFSEALVRLSQNLEPLTSLLAQSQNLESDLSEICMLINSCLIRFGIELSDLERASFLAAQVHGAINIGLEVLCKRSSFGPAQIASRVGFRIPFRVGLTQLIDLSKTSRKYEAKLKTNSIEAETATTALFELLQKPFPCIPAQLSKIREDFEISTPGLSEGEETTLQTLNAKATPFRFLAEIEEIKARLN
jgi:hypothetical protein